MAKINVKDTEITIISVEERDYISLTDMANAKESESRAADIIKNWIRTRYTLEFLGTWEQINNPNLKWWNLTTLKCRQVCQVLY
jgi:hypothetical protein